MSFTGVYNGGTFHNIKDEEMEKLRKFNARQVNDADVDGRCPFHPPPEAKVSQRRCVLDAGHGDSCTNGEASWTDKSNW